MLKPTSEKTGQRNIVIVVTPGVALLDIAGPCDVFQAAANILREENLHPGAYNIILASRSASHRAVTGPGVLLAGLIPVRKIHSPIDTLIIAGSPLSRLGKPDKAFYDWLATAHKKTHRTASICVGAFVLASAGILSDHKVTTHWQYSRLLRKQFPGLDVDDQDFVRTDRGIYTSGGIASGIDLSLKLIEEDFGRSLAMKVARRLVVPLKRPGSQDQYGALLSPAELDAKLALSLKDWIETNLNKSLTVEQMANQVNMSPRNFARVFLQETGLTPGKFLEKFRVEKARRLLEETDLRLKQISARCGLGSIVSMRRTFLRHVSLAPLNYRHSFQKTGI